MAGLKATQLSDQPVAFWTFDSDVQGVNGNQIVDEISNRNPMIVNSDIRGDNYELQQQSLNPIETADQYSMTVARFGKNQTHDDYLMQFFEVVHSTDFDFPDKGEFSVEWLMFKEPAGEINDYGEPGYYQTINTPLIIKEGVFSAITYDVRSGNDYILVSILGRSVKVDTSQYPIFNRTNHCVATYTVNQTDVNEYESIVRFYLNGRLYGEDIKTHVDTYPNTSTSASWLFCGNGGTAAVQDFATERLTMDQIAIYPYGLSSEQVANHYRKTKQYDQMIKDDYPTHYWRLNEEVDPTTDVITAEVGGVEGEYKGSVIRNQPGPDRIVTSHSPFFQRGSAGYIDDYGSYNVYDPILDTKQDYTLEFWFKSNSNDRGILFDMTEDNPANWDGLRVYLNSKDNQHSPGNIQISERYDRWVNSSDLDANGDRYLFNDDQWHHIAVVREGTTLKLIIDAHKHNESNEWGSLDVGRPGQITLMNGRPGDYAVEGNMCEVAFYKYALQDNQIANRYLFSTRYKISGYTLLQGAPVSALLRFYDTVTGDLVEEMYSNGNTGEYTYYPINNRHLDIISKLPENNTTRLRVHGPVAPAEYDDYHLN